MYLFPVAYYKKIILSTLFPLQVSPECSPGLKVFDDTQEYLCFSQIFYLKTKQKQIQTLQR